MIKEPTKREVEAAKKSMKVRFNLTIKEYQVYTYLAGTNMKVWKWFIVSVEEAAYYVKQLGATYLGKIEVEESDDDS